LRCGAIRELLATGFRPRSRPSCPLSSPWRLSTSTNFSRDASERKKARASARAHHELYSAADSFSIMTFR
jgi:hypothetical protein